MNKGFFKKLGNSLRQKPADRERYASRLLSEMAVPVKARLHSRREWEILEEPRRLARAYSFNNQNKLQEFISELLDYQGKTNHSGDIRIDHHDVLIEVYTKDLNNLTELDYEYAKMADMIYQDVEHYRD
jgi:pterin-4a-carbinolamine dehydratase